MKNQKYPSLFFIFYFLSFIFYLSHATRGYAQSYSLSISPSLLEILIKPGLSITKAFKITNNGDPVIITPRISSLSLDPDTNLPQINPLSETASSSWFSLTEENKALDKPIFLNTNQSENLTLKIEVPTNTTPSDYYYIFHLDSSSPNDPISNKTHISGSIGANILMSVSYLGTLNKNAEVSRINLLPIVDSFDGIRTQIVIKNTGSAYFKPIGSLTLNGILSSSKYKLLPQNVLAGTSRLLHTDLDLTNLSPFPSDNTLSLPGFFLGPYKLTLNFVPDGTSIEIKKTYYFFALPYKLILLLLLALAGVKFIATKSK